MVHRAIPQAILPCLSFLDAYPYPAFATTLEINRDTGESALNPVYTNPVYNALVGNPSDGNNHNSDTTYRHTRLTLAQKYELKRWIFEDEPTFFFELDSAIGVVPLDVTKTMVDVDVWICTTLPRIPIPAQFTRRQQAEEEPPFKEDITAPSPPPVPTPPPKRHALSIGQVMADFDWSAIPSIGPRENWSQSFRTAFHHVLASPHPAALFWGEEQLCLYNDSYIDIAGSKHPEIWGKSVIVGWSEVYHFLEPTLRKAMDGTGVIHYDDLFVIQRLTDARLPEEIYVTWSTVPVRTEDGSVGGFINHNFDSTDKMIAQRRMNSLRDLIAATIMAASLKEFSSATIQALSRETYSYDVSFAALYICTSSDSGVTPDQASAQSKDVLVVYELSGTIGIPEDHFSTPNTVSARVAVFEQKPIQVSITPGQDQSPSVPNSQFLNSVPTAELASFPWPFADVILTCNVVHMPQLDENLTSGFERRGWGDKPREAVVIPIGYTDQMVPRAILVLGVNPRRPYDATYQGDVDIMRMMLSSTLHATLNREAEVKRTRQLAELDAAKTAFFSNASHELRTPLTLIGGPLEDCISMVSEGVVKKHLNMAQRNVYRLTRLVDSLMDFSKLAANRLEGQFRPVKLGLLTADLASLFRNPLEKGGLIYEVKCDTDPAQPTCYIDPDLWEKVVFNLVGNAFKYTLKGTITVRVVNTTSAAVMTVEDTGCGIPANDTKRIFDRFHRVQTTSRSHEGTGIGLALTKELVTIHGGEITVDSNNEQNGQHGTTFTVNIPLGKAHLPPAKVFEEDVETALQGKHPRGLIEGAYLWGDVSLSSESEESSVEIAEGHANNQRRLHPSAMFFTKNDIILLADDNADMRRYARSILSCYCTVFEASNGQEALEIALRVRPNVVLSDVMMPVMDGLDLLKALRNRKETTLIPFVLVTARSGEDSQVEGLLSGADDYLVKPFKSAELIARVHLQMLLGKKRAEMEDKFVERTLEIQQLSELSPVAIFRADHTGRILYVNPKWHYITGHSKEADVDKWQESIHPADKTMVQNWWLEACEDLGGDKTPTRVEFRWNNGNWCQGQCVSLAKRGIVGAFTDISEHKQLEAAHLSHALEKEAVAQRRAEEAEERRQEAEERRRGQELLIDVTSHELRQPVSAILNCSSLVRANLSNLYDKLTSSGGVFRPSAPLLNAINEDLEALDAIYQCGLAQERIANDVLSLSRMQLNVMSIIPVRFDLVKEIGRIVALFRNETQMKKIALDVKFGTSLGMLSVESVCSDKARFAQIITNLLSNAIKFTDTSPKKREILVKIEVGLECPIEGSCEPPPTTRIAPGSKVSPNTTLFIFVSVTDSGPGLAPEDLSLLFQRFQQGSNSHDVFGGSGLGLFVSRQLCTLLGGRIEVFSPPGQGATFRFFIEAMTAAPLPPAPAPIPPTNLSSINSQPISVLIAEDNLINQTILNRQLLKAGCITTLANNGQEAVDALRSKKSIDVVLMDVEMPVMDGLSAVREIRQLESTGQLPRRHQVYALTGNAREGQVKNIWEAGMDDVIIKPYRIDELLAKIQSSPS